MVVITMNYLPIGATQVGEDGAFRVELAEPLARGHRIGIVLAEELDRSDYEKYAGDGRYFTAQGGWALESAIVAEP